MEKKRPNFFIVGTAKSGTTTLYNHLKKHQDIYFSNIKEPYFFSTKYTNLPHKGPEDYINDQKRKSMPTLKHYLQLFEGASSEKIIAEASTDYLYYFRVADDIKKMNPASKIVILLRNPVDRAFSAYYHQKNKGRETLTFSEALEEEENRIKNNYSFIWRYKQVGLYYKQVKYYLDVFGHENVKIFLYDELKEDINKVIKGILSFLNLNTDLVVNTSERHRATGILKNEMLYKLLYRPNTIKAIIKPIIPPKTRAKMKLILTNWNFKKPEMDAKVRKYLINYFKEDVKMSEKLVGKRLSHWLE